jgi:hypothetical protein
MREPWHVILIRPLSVVGVTCWNEVMVVPQLTTALYSRSNETSFSGSMNGS